jgi:hypothetical protein
LRIDISLKRPCDVAKRKLAAVILSLIVLEYEVGSKDTDASYGHPLDGEMQSRARRTRLIAILMYC